jgi:hypothetical protein
MFSRSLELKELHDAMAAAAGLISDQLPYLLLTGSSENYIRDTLAHYLASQGYYVARDYRVLCSGTSRKADVAIIEDETLRTVIELKQLYLKDFKKTGHRYVANIINDVTDRRSVCDEVYGIVLVRRIPSDMSLPFGTGFKYTYVDEDRPFLADGVSRLHDALKHVIGRGVLYPGSWREALVFPTGGLGQGVELYAWVIRAV